MPTSNVLFRRLEAQTVEGLEILDAVASAPGDAHDGVVYFFARGTSTSDAVKALGVEVRSARTVNGAPLLRCRPDDIGNIGRVRGHPEKPAAISVAEPATFAGKNVAIATRNGETTENVVDWLVYHHDWIGMDGAVIFERQPAGEASEFWAIVADRLLKTGKPIQVVVMEAEVPLGKPGKPAEAHPYSVAEAPGRHRMDLPVADPWRAPLYQMSIYEIARERFLKQARAITNIDLHDLLQRPSRKPSPFDLAESAPGTAIELVGQHCYPWRVRKGAPARFGDHICVQFDKPKFSRRWCAAPTTLPSEAVLKCLRVADTRTSHQAQFYRFMAVRHPIGPAGPIVPKTSLVEQPALITLSKERLGHKPVRPPAVSLANQGSGETRTAIVTTMKNEGPYILEWIAYHRAIGIRDFLVFTNDCTDGTDAFFDLLQDKGIVQHRDNPFRELNLKPQHAALQLAEREQIIQNADWLICMDVDEFINIKVGDGRLQDLYAAVGDANLISCTWRLFGNSDIHEFKDDFTIATFDRCAEEFSPKPHQAWGFKTLFKNNNIFRKMGVHRPKGLLPQLLEQVHWVNGSGDRLPRRHYRNAWRSTVQTYGYDLVSLNHYAVRNASSFLVKRDRGRVNHVDRDQGLAYWFRMNNNATRDTSIMGRIPMMEEELSRLLSDPDIARQHAFCVDAHKSKIAELKSDPAQMDLYKALTSPRMEKLSRMHRHFGANVFLSGPECVPDSIVRDEHSEDFFFTVERGESGS